jgi:hypothetical protein
LMFAASRRNQWCCGTSPLATKLARRASMRQVVEGSVGRPGPSAQPGVSRSKSAGGIVENWNRIASARVDARASACSDRRAPAALRPPPRRARQKSTSAMAGSPDPGPRSRARRSVNGRRRQPRIAGRRAASRESRASRFTVIARRWQRPSALEAARARVGLYRARRAAARASARRRRRLRQRDQRRRQVAAVDGQTYWDGRRRRAVSCPVRKCPSSAFERGQRQESGPTSVRR